MLAVMTLSAVKWSYFSIEYCTDVSTAIDRLNDTVQIIKIKKYLLIYANFTSRGIFVPVLLIEI